MELNYQTGRNGRTVRLRLPDFVRGVVHLDDRTLDLLEIAAYVFAADRHTSRGATDLVEYHAWSRKFQFTVKVRDVEFWSDPSTAEILQKTLRFMTGDKDYQFKFQAGHKTEPASLFDREEFVIEPEERVWVIPFSGGLDSLAGVIDRLEETDDEICLISHRSQPGTMHTQDGLFNALSQRHRHRLSHYKFECGLTNVHGREETQRTRSFLYGSIAFALASALKQNEFHFYENGVTSLNFARREDLMNARASRTTHPRTLALLADVFTHVAGHRFRISSPFMRLTKADVFRLVDDHGYGDLIPSSVSCSRTYQRGDRQTTHCGACSQCVDRRLAARAAGLEKYDHPGLYALDIFSETLDAETKTVVIDFIRQALKFSKWNRNRFSFELGSELVHVLDYLDYSTTKGAFDLVYELCQRHGDGVRKALDRINSQMTISEPVEPNTLLSILADREFLREPAQLLACEIARRMQRAIPLAFQHSPPKDENHFNDCVDSHLNEDRSRFEREHPSVSFARARVIPDHAAYGENLLIEAKYIRGSTTPAKATDGIAADLLKYPPDVFLLLLVYDPQRAVVDDDQFKAAIQERRKRCLVALIR